MFSGNTLSYVDTDVLPGQRYVYVVRATNDAGSVDSEPTLAETAEQRPTGLKLPAISITGGKTARAQWNAPLSPNGVILSYAIFGNEQELFRGNVLEAFLDNLVPLTEYEFALEVCNSADCARECCVTLSTPAARKLIFCCLQPVLTVLHSR